MRKLLNSLYVLSEDVYLGLDGQNIMIYREEKIIGRFPLHTLENIFCFSYKGASPALIGACCDMNITMAFYTPRGKFLARPNGKTEGNVLLRKQQYRISDCEEKSLPYAKNMLIGKVYNCRWSLERTIRDNGLRVNVEQIKKASNELYNGLDILKKAKTLDSLRGIEGELASVYFSVFDELIINQKENFRFNSRNRRPPQDNINALLSFAYSIIGNECAGALEGVGLDPYVGFLHRDRPGRKSLSLDLMEEFRGIMADRFVIGLINTNAIKPIHFTRQGNGAVLLNEDGRKIFFDHWQNRKKEIIMHPFLKEKIPWGLVPYTQALLLARTLRGDLDNYPPFLWK